MKYYESKYTGAEVDALLDKVNEGEASPLGYGEADNSAVLKGSNNVASGTFSVAIGADNVFGNINSVPAGDKLEYAKATGYASHAEGAAHALGDYSHAEGGGNTDLSGYKIVSTAEGECSHAEGTHTHAKGGSSHAEGNRSKASGTASHAEGRQTIAEGSVSHTEGFNTKTGGTTNENNREAGDLADSGAYAHAEGNATIAKGVSAHSEGRKTIAIGNAAHAEGQDTVAEGYRAHAEGKSTRAIGRSSHTEGEYTIANNTAEHASGQYNISTKSSDKSQATQFSIGIGTSDTDRKNAFEVKQNGDIYVEGVEGRIQDKLNEGGASSPMISITYDELKNLRDNGELIAGMQYRITDFVTTSTQENTQSAGHQFDVIVTADNENTLNEVARACRSEFDIEKYKDAYSASFGEKMRYVGLFIHDGKEYHLYESESQEMQMLMNFNNSNIEVYEDLRHEYPYTFYPLYMRYKGDESWVEWLNGKEQGDDIRFKHNLAEDTYFNSSNLAAWQIWYSLDNDTSRFAWALGESYTYVECKGNDIQDEVRNFIIKVDAVDDGFVSNDIKALYKYCLADYSEIYFAEDGRIYNEGEVQIGEYNIVKGKGVIYRMIDEFGNDCPYDFKNILFKRSLIFDYGYAQYSEDGDETWVYTFAGQSFHINNGEWSDMLDGSLESPFGHMSDEDTSTFHNNVIKPYIKTFDEEEVRSNAGRRYLNDNVFLGYWEEIGSIGEEDAPYYYSYCCNNNKLEEDCHANSFGIDCRTNTLERGCCDNILSEHCCSNVFGTVCTLNFFGSGCRNNIFGYESNRNTLGNYCSFNVWGAFCSGNTLGDNCIQNTFCSCSSENNLGESCNYNTFGQDCFGNRFEDQQGVASDVCYNKIDDNVHNVRFWVDDLPGEYRLVRYHHIYRGVNNREVELYTERTCETCVAIDSNGNLVEFVLADLKNS